MDFYRWNYCKITARETCAGCQMIRKWEAEWYTKQMARWGLHGLIVGFLLGIVVSVTVHALVKYWP